MHDYQARPALLKDRVILVTGAGDGIGAVIARTYAKHGATVILLGRTLEKLESVYDAIESAGGPQPTIVPMDLETATAEDYRSLAQQIEANWGHLDGLVHNAGILGACTPLEQFDPGMWNQVMQINVTAAFLMTQALIPMLKRSQDASVIFTSSGVGRKGRADWGAYAVSKFATEGLMQVAADELNTNGVSVRVNSVNPGATRTRMRAAACPEEDPGRNPRPEDIMGVYLYLMGPDSQGVTGQALNAQAPKH